MFTCDNCVHRYVCADWVQQTHYLAFPLTAETEEERCEFYEEKNTKINYSDTSSSSFVEGIKSDNTYFDVLNWYRNLYYKEDNRTEHGVMVKAIEDLFTDLKHHKAEKVFEDECKI